MARYILWAFSICLCVGLAHAKNPEPVLLRYQYPENQQLEYKNNTYVDMSLSGFSVLVSSEWKSLETGVQQEDTLRVNTTYTDVSESIRISSNLLQQPMMRMLEDKPFQFAVTSTGQLTDFTPPEPGHIGFGQLEMFELMAANLELGMAEYFPQLPDHPVTVGDSWTTERTYSVPYTITNMDGTVDLRSTYTVKKAKTEKGHPCFEIKVESLSKVRSFNTYGEMSILGVGTIEAKGTILLDYARGLILKYKTRGTLDSESTLLDGTDKPPIKTKAGVTSQRELKDITDH